MFSKRSSRFHRRNLSRRLVVSGAAGLAAGLFSVPGLPALTGSGPAGAVTVAAAGLPPAAGPAASYTLNWTAAHPPAAPPALRNAAAAYDSDTATVVLFGGVTSSGAVTNDTWVWDGRTWTEHPASSMTQSPPARQAASMAFDPVLHQLILFGGAGADGAVLGDTWAWNGASWFQLPPGPSGSPGAREGASLALGPNGNLVLFGGLGTLTAGIDSTTTSTTAPPAQNPPAQTPPAQTPTGQSSGQAAPKAPVTQASLAVPAFQVLGDTWQWTARGWAHAPAAGPSPRWGAALGYDSSARTTVLFGGDPTDPGGPARALADTWTWDGAAWTQQAPATSPPGRFQAVLTDDPAVSGAVLVTGDRGSAVLADGWVWDGSTWTAAPGGSAPGRTEAAGAFDAAHLSMVVFGGAGAGGSTLGDTELVTASRPAPTPPPTSPSQPGPAGPAPSSPVPTVPSSPTSTSQPTSPVTPGGRSTPATTGTRPTTAAGQTLATPGPSSLSLQTNMHNVRQGASVHLAGSGFAPGSPVTITFHSTPYLVGRSVAGSSGDFSAVVSVPRSAAPGQHHFVATGTDPDGRVTTLVASVFVLGPAGHKTTSLAVELTMLGLALLIPAGAWLAMTGSGYWRRRPRRPAG